MLREAAGWLPDCRSGETGSTPVRSANTFQGSSMAEPQTVNLFGVGSTPSLGAVLGSRRYSVGFDAEE